MTTEIRPRGLARARGHFQGVLRTRRCLPLVALVALLAGISTAAQRPPEDHPVRPTWMADGDRFWFASGPSNAREFLVVDPAENSLEPLFELAALREAYEESSGKSIRGSGLPFRSFELLDGDRAARFRVGTREFEWTFDTAELSPLPKRPRVREDKAKKVRDGVQSGEPAVMEAESPDAKWFAGIDEHDVYLREKGGGERRVLTSDGVEHNAYDLAEARWSPDSSWLAVAKVDEREVIQIPVMTWLDGAESVEMVPYTKTGQPLAKTQLHLLGVDGESVRVELDDIGDVYLYPLEWSPDGAELFFARFTRDYKRLEILAAGLNGSTRQVLRQDFETFLEPTFTINQAPSFRFLAEGERFLWLSDEDGFHHIYLHESSGAVIRQLTDGHLQTVRLIDVDEGRGWVYFSAHGNPKRPYDTQIWRVGLEGGEAQLVSDLEGVHDVAPYEAELMMSAETVSLSPSMNYLVVTGSTARRPYRTELRRADGELLRTLAERELTEEEAQRLPEPFLVKAADGITDLHGMLYVPEDFDPEASYPVVDYIYNGPQTAWVPHTFDAFQHAVCRSYTRLGFVALIVDGRGTTERGRAFQDFVYGNLGRHEIPDHVATIRELAETRPWMDLERVGVTGGSFGGYFTLRAMLTAPEFFKVGVSVAPIAALEDIIAAGAESYMGMREDDPEGYEYASCLNKAERLTGELMIIHGTADVNAPFGSTVKMVDALLRAGKDFEFVMLPDEPHFSTGRYGGRIDDLTRDFLVEHLKP